MPFSNVPTQAFSFTANAPFQTQATSSLSSSSSSSSTTMEDDLVAQPPLSPREPVFRPTQWKPIIDSPPNLSPPSTTHAYPQPWQGSYPPSSGSQTPPTPSLSPLLSSRADPVRIGSTANGVSSTSRTSSSTWRTSPSARASRDARRNELHASVSNVAAARIPLRTATSDMDVDSLHSNPIETSRRAVRRSAAESSDDELGGSWDDDGIIGWRARRRARAMRPQDAAQLASDDWALPDDASRAMNRAPAVGFPTLASRLETLTDSHYRPRQSLPRPGVAQEATRPDFDRPATLLRHDQPRRSSPRRSPGPHETRDTARAASREAAQPYRGSASEFRFGTGDTASGSLSSFGRGYTTPLRRFGDPELESELRRREARRTLRNLEDDREEIAAQRRRLQTLQARIGAQIETYYSHPDLGDFDQLPNRSRPGAGSRQLPSEQRASAGSFGAFSSRASQLSAETERLVDQMMRSPRPSIFETAQEIIYRHDRRRGPSGVATAMRVVDCKMHAELQGDVDECCAVCHDEYTPEIEVGTTPCKHMFHKSCLETWFETSATCPMCRTPMRDEDAYQEQRAAAQAIRLQLMQDLDVE